MYDPFAQGMFEDLPEFKGLSPREARRALSRAYLDVVKIRIKGMDEVSESLARDILFLRRLANALESRAVFDTATRFNEKRASAFVAAEALSLLADLGENANIPGEQTARIECQEVFVRVEASLLYLISGYDANASGVIRKVPPNRISIVNASCASSFQVAQFNASEWALDVIVRLCTFQMAPLPPKLCPVEFPNQAPSSLADLECDVRGRLYAMLGEAVRAYMAWLVGEAEEILDRSREQLGWLVHRLSEAQYPLYADIHHLGRLLLTVVHTTWSRSLVHAVPVPEDEDAGRYRAYLVARAKGSERGPGRPLLWPSTQKYVDECLQGSNHQAVVSMPTGSGKSFLAELAASHSLQAGWVLYLVPTNALAHQVRRDLRRDLSALEVTVRAFIGGSEYTTLQEERIGQVPARTIAVMTPEKCSLAMRLNPNAFATCRLCIFDECHLLGDKSRGMVAEIVLSQLMVLSPQCKFLLMSAIVQNPEELAIWLQEATGADCVPVVLGWRPTRSLRCAVGVDGQSVAVEAPAALEWLEAQPPRRRKKRFEANFAALAGLQGAWQTDDELDYAFLRLPARALLEVERGSDEPQVVSWVNESSRRLGEMLAEAGIPTLVFLPRSKHYPFSVGRKITLSQRLRAELEEPSDRVRALLILAEDELGLRSEVGRLIEQGVSVHTSAMLKAEQFASEEAFRDGATKIMLATGTLAQGLNLPAIAVVIGGTQIGYSPGEDREIVEQRMFAQLLNAAGRAGRAGFANQGLVIAVPDRPILLDGPQSVAEVSDRVRFLKEADAAIEISSMLSRFMDSIVAGQFNPLLASEDELTVMALLAGGSPQAPDAAEVLHRTYAAFMRRAGGLEEGSIVGGDRLVELRTEFVARAEAPEWLPAAAQRASLSFFVTLRLFQAFSRVIPRPTLEMFDWDIRTWRDVLFTTLEHLTPKQVTNILSVRNLERFFPTLHDLITTSYRDFDDPAWSPTLQWIQEWQRIKQVTRLWMGGYPIKAIATSLLQLDEDEVSSKRNTGGAPIPKTLAFVNAVIDRLALLAGGLAAIVEEDLRSKREANEDWPIELPWALSALPLAIKFGSDSPETLAWYRFAFRFRRGAHLLAHAFPFPQNRQDDNILSGLVHELRRRWLMGEIAPSQQLLAQYAPVFDAIRVILQTEPPLTE